MKLNSTYWFTQTTKRFFNKVSGSMKVFFMLLLLGSFFSTKSNAQPLAFLVDGDPQEWASNNLISGWPGATAIVTDPFGNAVDDQFTQGSKDFFLAEDLRWAIGQTKDKNDLMTGAAWLDGTILRFAGARASNNGDAQIGFWFYLNGTGPVTQPNGTRNFAPPHVVGDLLIVANFTNGGINANLEFYQWVGTGGTTPNTNGTLSPATGITGIAAQNNSIIFSAPLGWSGGAI